MVLRSARERESAGVGFFPLREYRQKAAAGKKPWKKKESFGYFGVFAWGPE